MKTIAEHHPERSGRHTTAGDILATADVFDVITQPRIYKLDYKDPISAIREMQFIPHLDKKMVKLIGKALSLNLQPIF